MSHKKAMLWEPAHEWVQSFEESMFIQRTYFEGTDQLDKRVLLAENTVSVKPKSVFLQQ